MIGQNIKDPKNLNKTTLNYVFEIIREYDQLCNLTMDLRMIPEKKKDIKLSLPYIISSITNGERNTNSFIKSNGVILDLDHVAPGIELQKIRDKICNDPYVHFAFISPSGDGLKVGIQLENYITDPLTYTKVYRFIQKSFKAVYKYDIDNTSDCVRACFLSHDPYAAFNPDSKKFPVYWEEDSYYENTYKPSSTGDADIDKCIQYASAAQRMSYQDWVDCAIALKAEFGDEGLKVFKALSLGKGDADSEEEIERKWFEDIPEPKSIGFGTFIYHVEKYGGIK